MQYQFVKCLYDGETTILARDEYGNKVMLDPPAHQPYFYVRETVVVPMDTEVVSVESGYIGLKQGVYSYIPLKKITMSMPNHVGRFRKKFTETWEADIPYERRVIIDLGIRNGFDENWQPIDFVQNPAILYFDIENLMSGRADLLGDTDPIIAMSLVSTLLPKKIGFILDNKRVKEEREFGKDEEKFDTEVYHFTEEREMLERFFQLLDALFPDIISGWNVENYDVQKLIARVKYLQKIKKFNRSFDVEKFWNKFHVFDLMTAYQKLFKSEPSYQLKNVIVKEGLTKADNAKKLAGTINKLYKEQAYDEIVEYNIKDSIFCHLINNKHKIIEYYWEYKNLCGVNNMSDTLHNSIMVDTALLRMVHNEVALPSVTRIEKPKDKYKGATLLPSSGIVPKGMFDHLAIYDMSRYYPSVIIAYNISPEVPIGSTKMGVIPRICKYFVEERKKWDKILEATPEDDPIYDSVQCRRDARKFALNSVYGVLGFYLFRLFSKEHAERVTQTCKKGILLIEKTANDLGHAVIYGDTDSVFISVKSLEEAEQLKIILNDTIKEKFDPTGTVNIGLEALADPVGFVGAKKRYFYLRIWKKGKWKKELVIKGFEFVRSDQSILTKDIQSNVFNLLVAKQYPEIPNFIRKKIKELKNPQTPLEMISIAKGISMSFHQYKVKTEFVRGAEYAIKYLNQPIIPPCKVKMVYIRGIKTDKDGKSYPPTNIICYVEPETLPVGIIIDYDKMIDSTIRMKIESLIELANIDWNQIRGQTTLKSYF